MKHWVATKNHFVNVAGFWNYLGAYPIEPVSLFISSTKEPLVITVTEWSEGTGTRQEFE
jgi:hypothetical protein